MQEKKRRPYSSLLYDMLQKWRTRLQEDGLTLGGQHQGTDCRRPAKVQHADAGQVLRITAICMDGISTYTYLAPSAISTLKIHSNE